MELIKGIKHNRIKIICSYLAVLIYFGIDRSIEYATDSYAALMMDDNWKVKVYENGRVLQGLLYYVIEMFHLPSGIKYQFSYLCAFIFIGLSIFVLSVVINKYIKNDILAVFISFLTIVNPFFVEFFLFIEKGMFCFVIFLNVCAVYLTEILFNSDDGDNKSYFADKKLLSSALVFLCLVVSVLLYQTLISLYVVLCLPFIALNAADFVKKNIYIGFMYAIPMGIAYILARFVFPVERLSGREGLTASFKALFDAIISISTDKFSYLSKGTFGTWQILLAVMVILFLLAKKEGRIKSLLLIGYEILGCMIISFAVVFFNDSDVLPRVVYSYASVFGIVLIYILSEFKGEEQKEIFQNAVKGVAFLLIAVICVSEYVVFQKCFLERYRCNQADLYLCNIIGEKIKEYEEETGNTVDTLCYYSDMARSWQEPGYDKTETSIRAQATGWSRTYSINYYLGTDYKEGEPDAELLEYYKNINWDTYADDQLLFEGNTLHICIY
ncbi:glucosyltransferase domain-containing protein [Butyrivibrio sp. AC2005]|uniref:glucosyltransferase domain-containing protein n=1 Tax=Butyrivibrio sp. AC2005 TaxID=1280672 RepID=UPI0004035D9F|nr:glucosyltransferase domain-containing protein [Butyrivibrio sp. AC2005]